MREALGVAVACGAAIGHEQADKPVITAVELTRHFEHAGRVLVAVDRVSFHVAPGEVYGLLGANGAGKTTTLRMILGLLQPTSGWAVVSGYRTDASLEAVKAHLGFVSASAGLYPWLTPREILLFFADLYDVPPQQAQQQLERLAAWFGLEEFLDRRSATLSTGQKQRVNLARSLMHDPPAILLDEPTRGLDVLGSQVILDYIHAARQAGKAILLCTHRLDEAERVCDRLGMLHRGRLLTEGTLAELQAQSGRQHLSEIFLALLGEPRPEASAA